MTVELTVADAQYVAYELAKELLALDEPIPDFSLRPPHKLEAVLAAPFASFDNKEKYPSLAEKAAVLFYAACKDHPFENGNKRMAVTLTTVFLVLNDTWLQADPFAFYEVAKQVAMSKPKDRDRVVETLVDLFTEHSLSLDEARRQLGINIDLDQAA